MDGSTSVTISDPDTFSVSPLDIDTGDNSNFCIENPYAENGIQLLDQEHFR